MATPRPTKAQRAESAREQALQMREAEKKKSTRNKLVAIIGAVAVVVIVGAVLLALHPWNKTASPAKVASRISAVPVSLNESGNDIEIGQPNAPVTVKLYVDLSCPWCMKFDTVNQQEIENQLIAGKIKMQYVPLAFLNGDYSLRAANAISTVAAKDPGNTLEYLMTLYKNQPAEGGSGLTDAQLASYAEKVGVPSTVTGDFTKGLYKSWINSFTKADMSGANAITGTPTILINGVKWEDNNMYTSPTPFTQKITAEIASAGK